MINLELPKKIEDTRALLRQFSEGGLRPISRKYDLLEQKEMPEELYDLAADPVEATDVAARFPAIAASMSAALREQWAALLATGRAFATTGPAEPKRVRKK